MSVAFDFDTPPLESIAYLTDKKPELHFDYDEIMHEAHHRAFTVAKVTKLDLLSDIHESLLSAQKKGQSFKAWKENIQPVLKEKGWWGETTVTNPKTGKVKDIYVGSRRLKTIYDTNMRTSYARGRYRSQLMSEAEYLRYSAVLDQLTRPKHAAMHGIVLPKDHSWWDQNYPPNGWHCRCKAQALTKAEVKNKGLKVYEGAVERVADQDWAYHAGRDDTLDRAYAAKVAALKASCKESNAKLPKGCRDFSRAVEREYKVHQKIKDRSVRTKQLNEMVDEVVIKKNKKYPINYIEVGAITLGTAEVIKRILSKDVEDMGIVLEKNRLLHSSPERKDDKYKNPKALRDEEMRQIVEVIEEAKEVYIDLRENHQNIMYVFPDAEDKNKVNKIIVDIDRKVKKFKKTNAVITLDKGDFLELEKDKKNGDLKSVE